MVNMDVLEIKNQVQDTVLNLPGVAGIGASKGSGDYINVYLEHIEEDIINSIPLKIGGVQTRIFDAGKFMSLQASRILRSRPMPMGISIGVLNGATGTAGAVCYDAANGMPLILSNNHILANSDSKTNNFAEKGLVIISPGSYDGGTANDEVGRLDRWVELNENDTNYIDAGAASIDDLSNVSDEILDIGKIDYVLLNAQEEMQVIKSGRSSGFTQGMLVDMNASIKVSYPGYPNPLIFNDIIVTTNMAIPGDSGAAALTTDRGIFGLVFAGTSTLTAICKIKTIMDGLGITFRVPETNIPGVPIVPQPPEIQKGNMIIPLIIGGAVLIPAVL